jgi:LDH2 family malate/lactate/ureidoglycolate dehydrogenase
MNKEKHASARPPAGMSERLPYESLHHWVGGLFERAGVSATDAEIVADALMRTEARGFTTHGLARIASYVEKLESGEFNAQPQIGWTRGTGIITCHADRALGQVAGHAAIETACAAAAEHPMVACRLQDIGHLGALGVIALPAAERGFVAVLLQATPPVMSLPGAKGPLIGNNPFAMAAPCPDGPPIVVDMACSVAARGNILLAARTGKPIPSGWALDGNGEETTDPAAALAGSILPFAGHKGFAVAMIVETLAASLTGAEFVSSLGSKSAQAANALLLVFNPDRFGDRASYESHVRSWTGHVRNQSAAGHRIPGDRAYQSEILARAEGVALSESICAELAVLGDRLGHPFLFGEGG